MDRGRDGMIPCDHEPLRELLDVMTKKKGDRRTSWADQEQSDTVILECSAGFFEVGSENLTRDLERTRRDLQRTTPASFCFLSNYSQIKHPIEFQVAQNSQKNKKSFGVVLLRSRRVHSKSRVKISDPNSKNSAEHLKITIRI